MQSVVNKIAEIEALLYDLDPHVTLLMETWLHAGVRDNEIIRPDNPEGAELRLSLRKAYM